MRKSRMIALVALLGFAASISACQWRDAGSITAARTFLDGHESQLNALAGIMQRYPELCPALPDGGLEHCPPETAEARKANTQALELLRELHLRYANTSRDYQKLTYIGTVVYSDSFWRTEVGLSWLPPPQSRSGCQPLRAVGWCVEPHRADFVWP